MWNLSMKFSLCMQINRPPFHKREEFNLLKICLRRSLQVTVEDSALSICAAYMQLGKRAFRRYANEKLLQDLAGPLDADQMAMLYAPPPFGEVQATVLARITEATADNAAARAWEPFRQVDMDMQVRRGRGGEARGYWVGRGVSSDWLACRGCMTKTGIVTLL